MEQERENMSKKEQLRRLQVSTSGCSRCAARFRWQIVGTRQRFQRDPSCPCIEFERKPVKRTHPLFATRLSPSVQPPPVLSLRGRHKPSLATALNRKPQHRWRTWMDGCQSLEHPSPLLGSRNLIHQLCNLIDSAGAGVYIN